MTAAIGMACGLGREVTAVLSALLALAVLALVPRLVNLVERMVGPPRGGNGGSGDSPRVIASPDEKPRR
jgi:putative Mg2+ transporter-C (MgtC) family protein